jgi:hypothetical protein
VRLLSDAGLVEIQGDCVRTAFPILDASVLEPVRERLRAKATRLVDSGDGEIAAIQRLLGDRNFKGHAFAIVLVSCWMACSGRCCDIVAPA